MPRTLRVQAYLPTASRAATSLAKAERGQGLSGQGDQCLPDDVEHARLLLVDDRCIVAHMMKEIIAVLLALLVIVLSWIIMIDRGSTGSNSTSQVNAEPPSIEIEDVVLKEHQALDQDEQE